MRLRLRKSTTFISVSLAVLGLFGIFAASLIARPAAASSENGRLISVHDRGKETVFLTQAETLKDAFKEVGIDVDSHDAVEPAIDEKLVASDYQVNIYRARPVTVIDGATRLKVVTPYQTPEQIIADVGIALFPEDTSSLSRSADIVGDGAGLQLKIDRATPLVLNLYGKKTYIRTQGNTVEEMLAEKGITLAANDRASLAGSTTITSGLEVRIWREGKQTVNVDEDVAFGTEQIKDADRAYGYKEIQTPGVAGKRTVTYEIEVRDGQEILRTEIAAIVTQQPKNQVEVVGDKVNLSVTFSADKAAIMTAAGVASGDQEYAAYIINNENALWCAIRWQGTTGCASSYYEKFAGAESSSGVGYGLCQATPGIKMATAGGDWRTNVVTQMKWCHSYAIGRYGTWEAAYKFKVAKGWW
ncbi:MAG: hypothetical protein JWO54_759 [Candidatus Saccharibacteria bacterium]|nr:hypothetical protein [Candidatus Saccharibacteria bacterium]MDB5180996.1 hypothetical protein [Candidatus Saccharibacteria bacterium]